MVDKVIVEAHAVTSSQAPRIVHDTPVALSLRHRATYCQNSTTASGGMTPIELTHISSVEDFVCVQHCKRALHSDHLTHAVVHKVAAEPITDIRDVHTAVEVTHVKLGDVVVGKEMVAGDHTPYAFNWTNTANVPSNIVDVVANDSVPQATIDRDSR